jgi:hypothetical protein
MDEQTRRLTFRDHQRKRFAAILRARSAMLLAETARDMAIVVLQPIKAANMLAVEEASPAAPPGSAIFRSLL